MSDILKKAKIPLILIVILFLAFLVYNFVFKKNESTTGLTEEVVTEKTKSQEFLPLLNLIRSVDFDDTFFSDKVFRSMVDFSQPVKEEKRGRDNPFSPDIVTSIEANPNDPVLDAAENVQATTTVTNTASTSPKVTKP